MISRCFKNLEGFFTVFYIFIIYFQLFVVAYDDQVPESKARLEVRITVARNKGAPVFEPRSYSETIDEFHDVNALVLQVNATDPEGVSIMIVMI